MNVAKIRNYKTILEKVHIYILRDNCPISINELDVFIKASVGFEGSTTKMNDEQLTDLIEGTYFFASQIGLELVNPNDKNEKLINLNFNRK